MGAKVTHCTMDGRGCEYWPKCDGCGFDRLEAERRQWMLRHGFLQQNKKGLRYLKLPKRRDQDGS